MQEKVNLPIVRQGYVCEESQYYMIGTINPKLPEEVVNFLKKNQYNLL